MLIHTFFFVRIVVTIHDSEQLRIVYITKMNKNVILLRKHIKEKVWTVY